MLFHTKELNKELFNPTNATETEEKMGNDAEEERDQHPGDEDKYQSNAMAVWNMVRDLHLELIFMYHRICVKLATLGPGWWWRFPINHCSC